jgi:hypothetical protein
MVSFSVPVKAPWGLVVDGVKKGGDFFRFSAVTVNHHTFEVTHRTSCGHCVAGAANSGDFDSVHFLLSVCRSDGVICVYGAHTLTTLFNAHKKALLPGPPK